MKSTDSTLSAALRRAALAEEQPPLLSREEIFGILHEAERKTVAPVALPKRPFMPRLLKIAAAAGLSAAAVLAVFVWKTQDTPQDFSADSPKIAQQTEPANIGQAANTQPQREAISEGMSQKQPEAKSGLLQKREYSQTVTANGRAGAPAAMAAIEVQSDDAAVAQADASAEVENTLITAAIVTPERIEPIIGKRLADAESTLGVVFDPPAVPPRQQAAPPETQSLGRSLLPEGNSLLPKNSLMPDSKRSAARKQPARLPEKSLMEILKDAGANPQAITLVKDGRIVANEWNFAAGTATSAGDLLPVYLSLHGRDAARDYADYALLWLQPASAAKSAHGGCELKISPEPATESTVALILATPEATTVSIALYDLFGNKIREAAQMLSLGKGQSYHTLALEGLPDGAYTAVAVGASDRVLASRRFMIERTPEK